MAPVALDDPAELYHAASKLEPALAALQLAELRRFAAEPALRAAASRPVRRHPYRTASKLPAPAWPELSLRDAVNARRSTSQLGGGALSLDDLSLLLAAASGITGTIEGPAGTPISGRAAPSGGGLFPLDLYVLPVRCSGLTEGVYRYDPERHALEEVAGSPAEGLGNAFARCIYQQELAASAALVVALVATFARSRVKYGQRAYRHVLLEAGHVVQGALVAGAAAGIRTVPLGGYLDRELERLLGVDGVRESVVHAFAAGRDEA